MTEEAPQEQETPESSEESHDVDTEQELREADRPEVAGEEGALSDLTEGSEESSETSEEGEEAE